jgi:pimeloyl-ACP methyl ester carboxylesterase
MAREDQQDTAALVLLSGCYVPTPRADVPFATLPAVPVLGDVLRYTVWPLLGWLTGPWVFRKTFAPPPVTEPFRNRFPLAMAVRPWQLRATAADAALMVPSAAAMFNRHRELTVPVVIMAGAGDQIVDTSAQSGRLHANIPQSDFHMMEGAGHMIHHIAPERVAEAIHAAAAMSERAILSPDRESRDLVPIET